MTSHGVHDPTTDRCKDSELRVPAKLIFSSFQNGRTRELEYLVRLKNWGSRVEAKRFFKVHNIHPKTGKRIVDRLRSLHWCGHDGKYIFPRSWSRIGAKKKLGLYLPEVTNKIEDLLFVHALKLITRRKETHARRKRERNATGLPVRYITTALNISERTYHRRMRSAIKSRLVKVTKNYTKLGTATQFGTLRKNLPGLPMYRAGKSTYTAEPSTITFL